MQCGMQCTNAFFQECNVRRTLSIGRNTQWECRATVGYNGCVSVGRGRPTGQQLPWDETCRCTAGAGNPVPNAHNANLSRVEESCLKVLFPHSSQILQKRSQSSVFSLLISPQQGKVSDNWKSKIRDGRRKGTKSFNQITRVLLQPSEWVGVSFVLSGFYLSPIYWTHA